MILKTLFISFYNDEAYGLRILHSILAHRVPPKKNPVRMLFFKLNHPRSTITKKEKQLLFNYIKEFNPGLLAFSLVSPNFQLYKNLYPKIRTLGDFKILIGGWQASLNPEETIDYCDYLCIGEGEEAIPELVSLLETSRQPDQVENIWTKTVKQKPRPLCINLSQFPTPIISNSMACYIDNNKLVKKDPYTINNRYGTSVGRGCPYRCTYCSNSYMATKIYPKVWSRIRYRTIDHVIEELKHAKLMMPKLEYINFYDEVFMPKPEWMNEFFKRYKEEINLPFYCMFFPGTCSEELVKAMVPAGLKGVWMGVQSGSPRVRKEVFKRHYTNEKVIEQAKLFVKYGVSVKYDFILNNPFETKDETEETIRLMADLPEPKSFNFFSLKYFPNTEITQMALDSGIINQTSLDSHLNIESPVYTVDQQEQQRLLERMRFYENSESS